MTNALILLDFFKLSIDTLISIPIIAGNGELAEWPNAPVLKTGEG